MIRLNQLTLPAEHRAEALRRKAAKLLRIPENEIIALHLVRRSIDARKKEQPIFSYIIDVELSGPKKEAAVLKKAGGINIKASTPAVYRLPAQGEEPLRHRPVIIGAGPAGLFAALCLAKKGFQPLLLEQGDDVDTREKKVEAFWQKGASSLDLRSNVQFGEGGAGTFSDGKLNTNVKDVSGRNREVLRIFTEAGADSSILYDSMPHIGTDVLRNVVRNIRHQIIAAGGEVRFGCQVTDIQEENGTLISVTVNKTEQIPACAVILAAGHSARDLFSVLNRHRILMEPKPFAVGLRVQHPQKQINLNQYGAENFPVFGAAPYKVTAKTSVGRGVYSFCMCPGGYVVNASSEAGRLAVNGMSNRSRSSESANSAIIVTVTPKDFSEACGLPQTDPLCGIAFQRQLEEKAFRAGNGAIPVQLYGDFQKNRESTHFGDVMPCFCGKTSFANLRECLPEELSLAFQEGMEQFGRKIRNFNRYDAVLAGVESRTSSPVRIVRGETMESSLRGLYPCGEGAGYAGGITSAAMDGMKVAETLIRRFRPDYE